MAKLSARGRTMVAEATRTVQGVERTFNLHHRLMSDGVVLHKLGKSWTVHSKLKAGVTPEQWKENQRAAGWTVS